MQALNSGDYFANITDTYNIQDTTSSSTPELKVNNYRKFIF